MKEVWRMPTFILALGMLVISLSACTNTQYIPKAARIILYNQKAYYWYGTAEVFAIMTDTQRDEVLTKIPDGFEYVGPLQCRTDGKLDLSENMQFSMTWEAQADLYEDPNNPHVLVAFIYDSSSHDDGVVFFVDDVDVVNTRTLEDFLQD